MQIKKIVCLVQIGLVFALSNIAYSAEINKGKKIFRKCIACHTLSGKHRAGPTLKGVFGRTAGAAVGYKKYSDDLKAAGASGLVWDEASLSDFLRKPRKYIGEKIGKKKAKIRMSFGGLKKNANIQNLVAYLKENTK